eukprot:bmy_15570T0
MPHEKAMIIGVYTLRSTASGGVRMAVSSTPLVNILMQLKDYTYNLQLFNMVPLQKTLRATAIQKRNLIIDLVLKTTQGLVIALTIQEYHTWNNTLFGAVYAADCASDTATGYPQIIPSHQETLSFAHPQIPKMLILSFTNSYLQHLGSCHDDLLLAIGTKLHNEIEPFSFWNSIPESLFTMPFQQHIRELCPRIVLGLISIKPVSERLLKAALEQGRKKPGLNFSPVPWHFCGNDLERGYGEKRDAPNPLYFFLSGMIGEEGAGPTSSLQLQVYCRTTCGSVILRHRKGREEANECPQSLLPGKALFSDLEWVCDTPKSWDRGDQGGRFPETAYHPQKREAIIYLKFNQRFYNISETVKGTQSKDVNPPGKRSASNTTIISLSKKEKNTCVPCTAEAEA